MRCSNGLMPSSTRLIQPGASCGAVHSLQPGPHGLFGSVERYRQMNQLSLSVIKPAPAMVISTAPWPLAGTGVKTAQLFGEFVGGKPSTGGKVRHSKT